MRVLKKLYFHRNIFNGINFSHEEPFVTCLHTATLFINKIFKLFHINFKIPYINNLPNVTSLLFLIYYILFQRDMHCQEMRRLTFNDFIDIVP